MEFTGSRFLTLHGADYSMLRSLIQKAIRKGEESWAVMAAMELTASGQINAVVERLIYIVDEDVGHTGIEVRALLVEFLSVIHSRARKDKVPPSKMMHERDIVETLIEFVLICCRLKKSHDAAWANMLTNIWPFPETTIPENKNVVNAWATAFEKAAREKKLETALCLASALDIISRVHFDKDIKNVVPEAATGWKCARQSVEGLPQKWQDLPAALAWKVILIHCKHPKCKMYVKDPTRLALMNAIMLWVCDRPSQMLSIPPKDVRRYAVQYTDDFFKPVTSFESFMAGRKHLGFPLWAIDKHTPLAKKEIRGHLNLFVRENKFDLPVEEWDRTHPLRSSVPEHHFTLAHFITECTKLNNPNPECFMFEEEGRAAYLEESKKLGEKNVRAHFLFGQQVRRAMDKSNVAAPQSAKRPREESPEVPKRKKVDKCGPVWIYEERDSPRDLLKMTLEGKKKTFQRRTSRAKKYVVPYRGNKEVAKGPYHKRSMLLEFRSACFHDILKLPVVIPVKRVITSRDKFWYTFVSCIDEDVVESAQSAEHTESASMGQNKVQVMDRKKLGIVYAREMREKDPNALIKCLDEGARRSLIAFYIFGVGDVQPGSNFFFVKGKGYLIDYEENTMSHSPQTMTEALFKRGQSADFSKWFDAYMQKRSKDIAEDIEFIRGKLPQCATLAEKHHYFADIAAIHARAGGIWKLNALTADV